MNLYAHGKDIRPARRRELVIGEGRCDRVGARDGNAGRQVQSGAKKCLSFSQRMTVVDQFLKKSGERRDDARAFRRPQGTLEIKVRCTVGAAGQDQRPARICQREFAFRAGNAARFIIIEDTVFIAIGEHRAADHIAINRLAGCNFHDVVDANCDRGGVCETVDIFDANRQRVIVLRFEV